MLNWIPHGFLSTDDMAGLALEEQEDFATFDEVYCDFEYMGLQCNLLRGIFAYGKHLWLHGLCFFVWYNGFPFWSCHDLS